MAGGNTQVTDEKKTDAEVSPQHTIICFTVCPRRLVIWGARHWTGLLSTANDAVQCYSLVHMDLQVSAARSESRARFTGRAQAVKNARSHWSPAPLSIHH